MDKSRLVGRMSAQSFTRESQAQRKHLRRADWSRETSCLQCRLSQRKVHLLSQEVELKRCPILSMIYDKECLVLLHGLRQFLKIGLSELSGQKICPALRMHSILHHPLVVIR
jgi:hypothetical protein